MKIQFHLEECMKKVSVVFMFVWVALAACSTTAVSPSSSPTPTAIPEVASESNSVFVSALGNDANSGLLKSSPLLSLQAAVNLAKLSNFTAIYISGDLALTNTNAAGYGAVLTNLTNVDISGGWNASFSSRSGGSVLNGKQVATSVLFLSNCYGVTLSGLALMGGTNISAYGGGLYMVHCVSNRIDCTVSNNYAYDGGGLYMKNCASNRIECTVSSNQAGQGGGIYEIQGVNNVFSVDVCGNSAGYYGGMVIYTSANDMISGKIVNNSVVASVAGLCLRSSHSNQISALISGNTARNYYAGGIYFYASCFNTISSTVVSNSCAGNGGGIYFYNSSSSNTISSSAVICYNRCDTENSGTYYGGGVYIHSSSLSISNVIESGAVTTPNYRGSIGTTVDDVTNM